MGTRSTSRASLLAAVVFALSVFAFTLFVWVSFGGSVPFGAKGYRVSVQFGPEASNLFPNADVRISGVTVGEVAGVDTVGGRIDAELELEPRSTPLPSDARAIVRSKTLLGEAYVELTPGSRTARKLGEGERLSAANVQEAQGLDDALSAFDERTRRDFRRFLEGVGDAFEGRGDDVNAALGNAPLAVADLRRLVDALDRQRGAVRELVRDTGTVLRTVADRGADARAIATEGAAVLRATAARDRQLTATVKELPPVLGALRRFSDDVVELSAEAAPTLRTLRPVAPLVRPGLVELERLAPELTSVARALDRTITAARPGLPAATSIVKAAGPLLDVLVPAARELVPVVQTIEAYRSDAMASLANGAAATNAVTPRADGTRDKYLRVLLQFNNESLYGVARRHGTHRENGYLRPGGMEDLVQGRPLRAFECQDAGNPNAVPPLGIGAPPCLEQEPFSVTGDERRQFPHTERDPVR